MRDRHRQLDMAHPITTHTRDRHFHAATVANDTFIFDALVFTTGTFVIAHRTENTLAEKTTRLRFECAVVNCFGIFNLSH